MAPAGAVNGWQCPDCGKITVVRHDDAGVTPMFLGCRATPRCPGLAVSMGYPADVTFGPTRWIWRKASNTEMKRFRRDEPGMYQHCLMGGLVLVELVG